MTKQEKQAAYENAHKLTAKLRKILKRIEKEEYFNVDGASLKEAWSRGSEYGCLEQFQMELIPIEAHLETMSLQLKRELGCG